MRTIFLDTYHRERFVELLYRANIKQGSDIERESLFFIFSGNKELYNNVNYIYNFKENNINIKINDNDKVYVPDLVVSSSAFCLLDLGFQLYNGSGYKNVMEIFSNLDTTNSNLAINAIRLRFNI